MTRLKSNKCDVVFLQETHMSSVEVMKLCCGWVGHVYYSEGSSNSRGVAILVNKNVQFKLIKQIKDSSGRMIIILVEIQGQKMVLANVYAPNGDAPEFFVELESKLGVMGQHYLVLGGDLNLLMDPILDHSGASVQRAPRAALTLRRICKAWGLVDIWRILNPSGRDYTFFSPVHKIYSRIDLFLISKALTSSVFGCSIGNIIISDHAWVCLNLRPHNERQRSYRWRLNSSLLQDPANIIWLKAAINYYVDTNWSSVSATGTAWEALKAVIRGRIIEVSSFLKKSKAKKMLELESKILSLETQLKRHMSSDLLRELTNLKYQYNNILSEKMEFILFKARQTYFESGDKAGKLLAHYIKQKELAATIPAIRSPSGETLTATKDINRTFKEFYMDLYSSTFSSTEEDMQAFLEPLGLPRLSESERELLDADITVEEIIEVIKAFPVCKAPGPDGFTAEFFKSFSTELAPLLLEVYNEALTKGQLPPTFRQALISLVPKKGKDPCECRNYRPISLIQMDVKIISKVLANRLNKVITSLIHPDQVGFIHGRNASDNIRRFINIMWKVANDQSPMAAISLDGEKAFDTVEITYLFKILETYGFGSIFTNWIKLLYKQPEAAVQTNGLISDYFALGRGTRQGSPLSPLLFCLVLEPLAAAIRMAPDFPGITAGGKVHKLMLFADDILLFVSEPNRSLTCLLNIIRSFSKFSGYKVNWSKSEALPLTAYCPPSAFQLGAFQWPTQGLRYLGIIFPPLLKDLVKVNFDPLLHNIACDVKRWAALNLSMVGKVNVLKMNCVPKLNYLIHSIPLEVPLSYFKWFDTIVKTFIWNGKKPRLHLNKLWRPMDRGGLGLPKLLYYYYAFNLRHLAHWSLPPERAPPWHCIEQSVAPVPLIQCLSIKLSGELKTHPVFSHLIVLWSKVAKQFNLDPHLNVFSSIWLNPKLCINKSPIWWKEWYERGIVTLNDLYHNNILKSFQDLVQQFGISKSQFYRYLQLRHLLMGTFRSDTSAPKPAGFLEEVLICYTLGGKASTYYSQMIRSVGDGALQALKLTWERDLSLTLEDDEWDMICKNIRAVSRDARVRLIQFKIIHRFYWTPSRMFRLGILDSPKCWRCKAEDGHLVHALWYCDKVQQFWKRIHTHISEISETHIDFCPRLFVLGDGTVLTEGNTNVKSWILTSIMIGKQILLRGWKAEGVPSFQEWTAELARVAAFEKMSYRKMGKMDLYGKKWGMYVSFITESN